MAGGLHCELAHKGKHADIPSETQSQSEQKGFSGFCLHQPAVSRVRVLRARQKLFKKMPSRSTIPVYKGISGDSPPSLSRHFPSQEPPFAPISAGFHLSEWHIQLSHFRKQLSCRKTVSVLGKTLSTFQKTVSVLLRLSLSCTSLRLTHITEE